MGLRHNARCPGTLCSLVRAAYVQGRSIALAVTAATIVAVGAIAPMPFASADDERGIGASHLDAPLKAVLRSVGFTGKIEAKLETDEFLGRKVDPHLADLGRMLFFDSIIALHGDNACAGCHSPAAGFSDTQSIAIGVDNNGIVGPNRAGPRNQRRSPLVVNTPFYPKLMWNGRFSAPSGNPFDNSQGFKFPPPEGTTRFPPDDPNIEYLLVAQAHIPSTELVEMAGFTGVTDLGKRFRDFNDGHGSKVPPPDKSGFRNEPIRKAVLERLNATPEYRRLFEDLFRDVRNGKPIDFSMVGGAIAEFELTLVRANAPIDRYARGDRNAMTESQKRGALLFFGKGNCVTCHAVAGKSNEMFSDFEMHNTGVPQVAPDFGVGKGNVIFDGPSENEDFGLAQLPNTSEIDRYKFRSSPLRNVALQPAFFHNGAFTRLEDAIRHHVNVRESARHYDARKAGVDHDLTFILGPIEPVLATLDPFLKTPIRLSDGEFRDLVAFVRDGLLDPRARPATLCGLIPRSVPSGRRVLFFEGC